MLREQPMQLRPRQSFGKYRIRRRLAEGGFASVYRAYDTLEGISVALKIPHRQHVSDKLRESFKREIRLSSRLRHPNILPLKNAEEIDGRLVLVYPLGEGTLGERLARRLTTDRALDYGEQLLEALAHAHAVHVIHCDVKPDNLILLDDDTLALADFGIAKISQRTVLSASGSGTLGYVAPEQALGQPSFRSDCFSAGLVLYRMLSGSLPRWPYQWPLLGAERLRGKVSPAMIALLRRALSVNERQRFAHAGAMLTAFRRARSTPRPRRENRSAARDSGWREQRLREFQRQFGKLLDARFECARCDGPVSEAMHACPWCGREREQHRATTRLPAACKRCGRGMKLDWTYCAHCYGAAQGPRSERSFADRHYVADCRHCKGRLLAFSRYCPWCRRKVERKWKIPHAHARCERCGWDLLHEFWTHCPWCGAGRKLGGRR